MNRFPNGLRAKSTALVLGLGLLSACTAYAQTRGAQMRGNFDDADANHDGRVTLQEYQDYITRRLNDSSGRLAQKFKQLSPQDQAARLQKRFNKLDHDHKGYLDRKDWSGS